MRNLRFKLFGMLQVMDGEDQVEVSGQQRRTVLAVLLTRAGFPVTNQDLHLQAWGSPTQKPSNNVQKAINYLRDTLEPDRGKGTTGELITSENNWYTLRVSREDVDIFRFQTLIADGDAAADANDPATAMDCWRRALDLWAGPPLEEFKTKGWAKDQINLLREKQVATYLRLMRLELAVSGTCGKRLHDLRAQLRQSPERDDLLRALVLGRCWSGLKDQALTILDQFRSQQQLSKDLDDDLSALRRKLLNDDPALDPIPMRLPPEEPTENVIGDRHELPGELTSVPATVVGDETGQRHGPRVSRGWMIAIVVPMLIGAIVWRWNSSTSNTPGDSGAVSSATFIDQVDPRTPGCDKDAETAEVQGVFGRDGRLIGQLELRRSGACQAMWGRLVRLPGSPSFYGTVHIEAHRPADGKTAPYDNDPGKRKPEDEAIFGDMLSIRNACVYVEAYIVSEGDTSARTSTNCLQ